MAYHLKMTMYQDREEFNIDCVSWKIDGGALVLLLGGSKKKIFPLVHILEITVTTKN